MAEALPYLYRPGVHSHNRARTRQTVASENGGFISALRWIFLLAGLSCIGYFAYTWADENIYQSYQNWAFDQQKASKRIDDSVPVPVEGGVIGRVAIDRLAISAMVRQGVDAKTLREAVGHVPTTALPGSEGNFAIAAHRDTLFRGLKDIQLGDTVRVETSTGQYEYKVAATKIVKPSDVSVLQPAGGGLIPIEKQGGSAAKLLTMITCYPFYYVGAAPERFIVQAQLVEGQPPKPQ